MKRQGISISSILFAHLSCFSLVPLFKRCDTVWCSEERKKKKLWEWIIKVSSRPHAYRTHSHYTKLFAFCLNAFELKAFILSTCVMFFFRDSLFLSLFIWCWCCCCCFHTSHSCSIFHTLALLQRTFTRSCVSLKLWKGNASLDCFSIPQNIIFLFTFCYSMKLYWMCDYISLMNRPKAELQ